MAWRIFFFFFENVFSSLNFFFLAQYTHVGGPSHHDQTGQPFKKKAKFIFLPSHLDGKKILKKKNFETFPPLHPDSCIREHVTDGYRNHVWRHHVYLLEEKKSDDSPAYWTDTARRWVDRVSILDRVNSSAWTAKIDFHLLCSSCLIITLAWTNISIPLKHFVPRQGLWLFIVGADQQLSVTDNPGD